MATAQVRPEYAHLYPALARGQWYQVCREAVVPQDDAELVVEAGVGPVEVAVAHVVCRRGAEAR